MTAPGWDRPREATDRGRDGGGGAGGAYDQSNRSERQDGIPDSREDDRGIPDSREDDDGIPDTREDDDGIPDTREEERNGPAEDESNRYERRDRGPYEEPPWRKDEGGSSYSEYRPGIGQAPPINFPKSRLQERLDKILAGKNPDVDERTGKLDPKL